MTFVAGLATGMGLMLLLWWAAERSIQRGEELIERARRRRSY